jgi:hypothetical protein
MDNKNIYFGGTIGLNGAIYQGKTPTFTMDLGLNQVNIASSYAIRFTKKLSTCRNYKWKLNSTIKLNGNLNESMSPDLKTLTGVTRALSTTVNATNSTLLTALGNNLKFIDVSKLNLNDLKAASLLRTEK